MDKNGNLQEITVGFRDGRKFLFQLPKPTMDDQKNPQPNNLNKVVRPKSNSFYEDSILDGFLMNDTLILTNSQVAYTRKRGAGVKNYSLLGGEENSPMNSMLLYLSSLAKHLSLEHNGSFTMSPLCLVYVMATTDRLINTITRLMDDRASMLRRAGDEVSLLTATGGCLLLQDLDRCCATLRSVLLACTAEDSSGHVTHEMNRNGSALVLSFRLTDIDTSPAGACISANTASNMWQQQSVLSSLVRSLLGRVSVWLPRRAVDGVVSVSDRLRTRVEDGLGAVLYNSVSACCSKMLRPRFFVLSDKMYNSRKCCGFGSLFRISGPDLKRVGVDLQGEGDQDGCMSDVEKSILAPLLAQCKAAACDPDCMRRVVTVAANSTVSALLTEVLDRKLRFNERGVFLLHGMLAQLTRWLRRAKQELGLPHGVRLICGADLRPWERADAIVATLHAACCGDARVSVLETSSSLSVNSVSRRSYRAVGVSRQRSPSPSKPVPNNGHMEFSCSRVKQRKNKALILPDGASWVALASTPEFDGCGLLLPLTLRIRFQRRPTVVSSSLELDLTQL